MKRLWFLIGVGVGFVLGSRAGRGPYQQLEANVRKMLGQPEVRHTMAQVRDTVQDKVNDTAGKIGDALPNVQETPSTLISQ
jgi:hypothetical protein